ncbi:DNA helicase RecQ [Oxalobacter paraformigenes]|uniref:DNA helicase RecQ n=1 Tax=Oxalobacter paraformigenes TaxID=556268 RepID=C3X6Q3_9BURK|nr:DNA helicase RecQ [Oxalobacter paraformigenes]EEO28889.1 ATP-dependent DNA helicase RecQ [Oxalobacter paraformigenes]
MNSKKPNPAIQSRALEILQTVFGYPVFRGQQEEIIEHVASGHDALILMPTGGGKSLCYQIPALIRDGVGIVVSPLIALMQDQVDALETAGVRAAYLNSTQSYEEAFRVERAVLENELDLVYIAPERLVTSRCLNWLQKAKIALFAIDEAHCVSQWGHDFRPEYIQLSILHEHFPDVPRIALTATADRHTRDEIVSRLKLDDSRQFISSFDRPNIRYCIVEKENPRRQLLDFILSGHRGDAGIVYCLSRRKVEETVSFLTEQGISALPYHAGLGHAVRTENQARFLREDGIVMVATIAFGMGIDKPDVRFVAHLDLPKSMEGYYQETGRAGRDGNPATAWMAYGLQDVVQQRRMIDESDADFEHRKIQIGKLDALLGFCESLTCRRVRLLEYFGESSSPCGNCDTCLSPPVAKDGTKDMQKLLSTVYRVGQRFGAVHVINVLRGISSERVLQWNHNRLSTFGIGAEQSEAEWRSVLRQAIAAQYVFVDNEEYNALKLTEKARPVLKGELTVLLRPYLKPDRRRKTRLLQAASQPVLPQREQKLFERLKWWRMEIARQQNMPAYVIFQDATLREIALAKPLTEEELLQISGIGNKRLAMWGSEILKLVDEFTSSPV